MERVERLCLSSRWGRPAWGLLLGSVLFGACSESSQTPGQLAAGGSSAQQAGAGHGGSGQEAGAAEPGAGKVSAVGGGAAAGSPGCGQGETACADGCKDLRVDGANCGQCGTACEGGMACVASKCRCPAGQEVCGGACVNLNTLEHCGSCDNACAAAQVCAVTTCISENEPCPDGLTRCGSSCVDLKSAPATCGSCETSCGAAQDCAEGKCVCPADDPDCAAPSLLLSVAASGHYLVTSAGTPFQIRGDTPWALAVQLSREQATTYLDDRKAKGFNVILFQAVNVDDGYADNAPKNAYGELPFVGDDFTKPNEAYWKHVDFLVSAAAERGVVAFISPLYLGFAGGSEGWYTAATAAGASAIQTYGAFVGARYRDSDNVVWVNGGDFRPPTLEIPDALANGILSKDKRHLLSTHWGRNSSGRDGNPKWLTLGSSYTEQANISSRVLADYQATPALPTFLIEAYYEGTLQGQPLLTTAGIRQEAWHALLSGAAGALYGHHTIWPFDAGWQAAMAADGAKSMAHMHGFFDALSWWKLAPDAGSKLVTSGRGTLGSTGYVAASLATDGSLAVAYIPDGREITVDMAQLKGSVTARFFDPAAGSFSAVPGSPFANTGPQKIDPPGGNDAVLLLEAK